MEIIQLKKNYSNINQIPSMKKLILISLGIIFTGTTLFAQQNIFQLTIKKVPDKANAVKVFMRPNANKPGQISSMQFALSIPLPLENIPVAQITSSITGVTYVLANSVSTVESFNGINYRNWTFLGTGGATTPTVDYMQDVEYEVAEVAFTNPSDVTTSVRLSAYPDGGTDGQSYFYMALNGLQMVNTPAQFYGPGAVNGVFETGYSFVPLSDIILPVDFLSFYAMKSGNDAKLSWSVAGDETNSHFEVLRSVNGRNYTSVQTINALANGLTNNTYEALDINLSKLNSREVFYQIAQFDKDGTKTMSPVRKLSVDGLGKSVTAFPNPAKTTTKVVVDATEAGKGSLIMRDATGRQVQVMNAQFFRGINQFDMNVSTLPSGEYNIQVNGGGLNETIKLTKIN
jgi:hypothetical protein